MNRVFAAPDGEVPDDAVEVPTPFVTCPVFAGERFDELVITTAFQPLGRPTPGAGDLYGLRPGVAGRPPSRVDLHVIATGDR
jgi:sugar lactone lactonase YvrE